MATNAACSPASARQSARDNRGRFLTGNIGGPGRPKGTRNKLGEDFIAAVYADWTEHGATVLARVREQDPSTYLKITANLIPNRLELTSDTEGADLPEQSADELIASLIEDIVSMGAAERFLAAFAARGFTPQPTPQSDRGCRLPLATRRRSIGSRGGPLAS